MARNGLVSIKNNDVQNNGVDAFINRQTAWQTVMSNGSPWCHMGATVSNLENWLTTLELLIENDSIPLAHRWHLQEIRAMLEVAHEQHIKDHNEVVTEAPTPEDQLAYLAAYAAAIGGGQA